MQFEKDFLHQFRWKGADLRVGPILPSAAKKISEGLKSMSKETIRHRFFGIKNGFTDKELKHLTVIDGFHHFALGVEEVYGQERGVAVIRMVRDDLRPTEAEIAVLVIDEYQKTGLGTLLLKMCLLATLDRGITVLRFTFMPDNTGILKLIQKFGLTIREELKSDYVQHRLELQQVDWQKIKADIQFFLESDKSASLDKSVR